MKPGTLLGYLEIVMSKPLSKMTKAELLVVIATKDAELAQLRAGASRAQAPTRHGPSADEFRRRCEIRKAASAKYFAAHPELRSAPMKVILAWAANNG